jgi:ribosomal protein L14E/L6E/L27E
MYSIGEIVISKRGHDKGGAFVIVGVDGEYLYLADGKLRKLAKPKKKKSMHVQNTNSVSTEAAVKLKEGSLVDADLRKVLLRFVRNEEV